MKKALAIIIALFAIAAPSFGQGYVSFVNSSGTRVSTNSVVGGPATGTTAPVVGSYYFALFAAPTTQTNVDTSLTGWTFAALGTNTTLTGRVNGNNVDLGNGVLVPNFAAGTMANFTILGWSANLGTNWQTVKAELAYYLANGVVHGPGEFIGQSSVVTNIPLASLGGPYNFVFGTFSGLIHGFLLGLYPANSLSITGQPQNQVVVVGQDATFNVAASGNAPFSYQWQFNGSPVSGATNSSYTVAGAQPADAGKYSVLVTNVVGNILSSNATLTVLFPPSILAQPQSQTAFAGSDVQLSVTVTSSPPSTYQWKFNGTKLAGATAASLALTNVSLTNAGNYTLAATNSVGYALSSNATLTVYAPPSVIMQPQGQIGYWGKSVTLSVGAQGTDPMTYLWYKDGVAILWATNSTLELNDLQLNAGGQYSVAVSNAYGGFVSTSALLIVNPAGISFGLYPGITIDGTVGKTYGIQYVTNVLNTSDWTTIATVTLTQAVQMWFDAEANVNGGQHPSRSYRVVAMP